MTAPSDLETTTDQPLEPQADEAMAGSGDKFLSSNIAEQGDPPPEALEPAKVLESEKESESSDATKFTDTSEPSDGNSDLASLDAAATGLAKQDDPEAAEVNEDDELPNEVEMSLFDHLEELRQRIFVALIAVVVGAIASFAFVKPIVRLLEIPAQGVKFLQLAPGEFFFVSIKVAGYCGILFATPVILYQIAAFVLPGLTRKERRILGPVVFGSSILFVGGLAFAYIALIPAALNFFITYGADVVEQSWSIEKYFDFVLLLMLSTGLAFQVPIIQALLGFLGVVSSQQMLSSWKLVLLGSAIVGAVLTPSTDPLTQGLLGGAMVTLYFAGIGFVKLLGK